MATIKKKKNKQKNKTTKEKVTYSDFRMILKWKRASKTQTTNESNKTERGWLIERIQTRVAFDWLSEGWGEKTLCPRTL